MASIPTNVILIHTGTNASIPSGWTRETSLDGVFPKGWGDSVAPNQTGGATTHTHTSPSHTHSIVAHTHTFTTSDTDWTINAGNTGTNQNDAFNGSHHHHGTSGAASGGDISGTTTYASVSNDPPYRKVIFIKANAGAQLATDIVALWGTSDTAPTNWSKVTELSGRYLKGAGTGADADLTTDNGSSTNLHGITHSHTGATHTHAAGVTDTPSAYNRKESSGGGSLTHYQHTHSITLGDGTQNVSDNTDTLTTTETVEPVYRRLHAIKKGATGLKEKGIIGLWLGSTASIPGGWSLYTDMKDNHLKIGDPTTSATGGSNTHTHAAQAHSHTGNGGHTHTGSGGNHPGNVGSSGAGQNVFTSSSASHTVTSDSTTANYGSANTTADSSSNEPEYRTVAFIRFDKEKLGASILSLLMDAE